MVSFSYFAPPPLRILLSLLSLDSLVCLFIIFWRSTCFDYALSFLFALDICLYGENVLRGTVCIRGIWTRKLKIRGPI